MSEPDSELPVVRVERPVYWFAGPIALLPRRGPFISPELLLLEPDSEVTP